MSTMTAPNHSRAARRSILLALALALPVTTAVAQLDRNKAPKVGKSPTLRVPTWTKTRLTNGAQLIVVEKHDLPLVALNIDFVGGATSYEPAAKLGGRGVLRAAGQPGQADGR